MAIYYRKSLVNELILQERRTSTLSKGNNSPILIFGLLFQVGPTLRTYCKEVAPVGANSFL